MEEIREAEIIEEIAECGCKPTTEEFCKKLFI